MGLHITDQDRGMGKSWSEAPGKPVFLTSTVVMGSQLSMFIAIYSSCISNTQPGAFSIFINFVW